ncbi:MAG: hypothetical protein J6B04_04940 [Clostridia bacterium]|nr:hypothetical protein [Clostridia bacterium]
MKTKQKVIFSTIVAVLVAIVSALLIAQAFNGATVTKGLYGKDFVAIAEEESASELGVTYGMYSTDKKYLLVTTALRIENPKNYTEVGYVVTKDGVVLEEASLKSNAYYTSITVKTGVETSKTYQIADIFANDLQAMGMIVAEIDYDSACTYTIQAYVVANDGTKITGSVIDISKDLPIIEGGFDGEIDLV